MWSSVRSIQLLQFDINFDKTLLAYSLTATSAILWPIVAGWLSAAIISFPAFIAPEILPSIVADMLASHPSSCIWSPRYFLQIPEQNPL